MRDKKLQIFVSSTYTDLKEERQAAVEAILSSGHIPAGMELFSAGDESQMTVIERWIEESDIYLLILGGRYGSVEAKSGKSYTHLEYEYALSLSKPLFAVVIDDQELESKVKLSGTSVLELQNPNLLKEFKQQVMSNLVKFWCDKKDIKIAIHETLAEFSYRKDLTGWIRGDNHVNTAFLAEEIARLTKENSDLRLQLQSQPTNNDSALYANMSFEELTDLLARQKIESGESEISLLDYLLDYGVNFTRSVSNFNPPAFEKLRQFKVIQRDAKTTSTKYTFTEDGHNFYLKAILKRG